MKERFWRRHVEAWRNSGESVRAYCAAQMLSEPSFYACPLQGRAVETLGQDLSAPSTTCSNRMPSRSPSTAAVTAFARLACSSRPGAARGDVPGAVLARRHLRDGRRLPVSSTLCFGRPQGRRANRRLRSSLSAYWMILRLEVSGRTIECRRAVPRYGVAVADSAPRPWFELQTIVTRLPRIVPVKSRTSQPHNSAGPAGAEPSLTTAASEPCCSACRSLAPVAKWS